MTDDSQESGRDDLAARRGLAEEVYPPSEDSALLAEVARDHARGLVLDLGTGSGWVAERVSSFPAVSRVIGSDLNPHACRAARTRGVEPVRADLLAPFRGDTFDTVLFNPPYLPTVPEMEQDDWMEQALSGGRTGRETIEPFLSDLPRVLSPEGMGLLLVSSLTGLDAVTEHATSQGLYSDILRQDSYPYETLSVLGLRPDASNN